MMIKNFLEKFLFSAFVLHIFIKIDTIDFVLLEYFNQNTSCLTRNWILGCRRRSCQENDQSRIE